MSRTFVLSVVATIGILAGCTPKIQKPTQVCPGKRSVADALAALRSNAQNMVPFRANGQCYLEYYPEGKSKPKGEQLTVQQLWVDPPFNVFFQGDKPPLSKVMILGSNANDFWLAIRPEISLYCWGKWSEQEFAEGPLINPRTLLEALGIGEIETERDWSLSNKGPYDILTKREGGAITKKIYIFSCDYRVRKIEFFDPQGQVAAVAELDRYEQVSEGFFVPALTKVTTYSESDRKKPLSFTLDLHRIRPTKVTELQRDYLFRRPSAKGFKKVVRVVNGEWINGSE